MDQKKLIELLKEQGAGPEAKCLLVWASRDQPLLEQAVNHLNQYFTEKVLLENSERLSLDSCGDSLYDVLISGVIQSGSINHDDRVLQIYIKLMKPGGKIVLGDSTDNISTALTLNGFINTQKTDGFVTSQKPEYAVGSSAKLGLKIWKIDDDVESAWKTDAKGDEETIDADRLLDEDDLKKPDPSSLRVCGTTGLRKACADCSCGLAEELRGETKTEPKSSCGSCYLGDAFRCASCPYLGMPAFKPGEKVLLDLKSDI